MKPLVTFHDLGRQPYEPIWRHQEVLMKEIIAQKIARRNAGLEGLEEGDSAALKVPKSHLIFVEHPHVLTLGKSGDAKHVVASPERLKALGVEYFPINRGGDITYHGPGQLVGYPHLRFGSVLQRHREVHAVFGGSHHADVCRLWGRSRTD